MKNNNKRSNFLTESLKKIPETINSSAHSAAAEIVIYDECGDSLWDKVLAQTNTACE